MGALGRMFSSDAEGQVAEYDQGEVRLWITGGVLSDIFPGVPFGYGSAF